jgi:hypothetical protein
MTLAALPERIELDQPYVSGRSREKESPTGDVRDRRELLHLVVYFAGAEALRSPTIIARGSRSRRQARSLVHRRHHPRQ